MSRQQWGGRYWFSCEKCRIEAPGNGGDQPLDWVAIYRKLPSGLRYRATLCSTCANAYRRYESYVLRF